MQPLVQSALDAANRGENNKALEFCKQALAADPNDVDAWLVVAAVVEQPERKRQCLNRVLALDPTNPIAREELLDMDRAAMGGTPLSAPEPVEPAYSPSSPSYYPASTSAFEPEPVSEPMGEAQAAEYPASTSAFESAPAPAQSEPIRSQVQARPPSRRRTEKPLVFKYPLFYRIVTYFFLIVFLCLGLVMAAQDIASSLPVFGLALLTGISVIFISPKVEITETGIHASGMFSSSAVKWSEIKSLKSGGLKQRLELLKSNGQIVKVSSQVSGYPRIVEILRQKRPDLFGMAVASSGLSTSGFEQSPAGNYGGSVSAPAFAGAKTFRKSFIRQYGINVVLIFFCLLFVWLAFQEPENQVASFIAAGFCLLMMVFTLFQVSAVKVEPNRLTIEALFEQKELSARQIRDIKMQSVRGRHGRVTNFVVIIPAEGKKYSLGGFPEGEEILYGFLTNWWDAYRNR